MRGMDGLLRSVGDGIGGLVGGALSSIQAALDGIVASLSAALPAGALPVVGIAVLIAVGWFLIKR